MKAFAECATRWGQEVVCRQPPSMSGRPQLQPLPATVSCVNPRIRQVREAGAAGSEAEWRPAFCGPEERARLLAGTVLGLEEP